MGGKGRSAGGTVAYFQCFSRPNFPSLALAPHPDRHNSTRTTGLKSTGLHPTPNPGERFFCEGRKKSERRPPSRFSPNALPVFPVPPLRATGLRSILRTTNGAPRDLAAFSFGCAETRDSAVQVRAWDAEIIDLPGFLVSFPDAAIAAGKFISLGHRKIRGEIEIGNFYTF